MATEEYFHLGRWIVDFGDEGQSASHWSCCELMDRAAPGCMRRIKGTGQYAGISGGGGGGGGGGSHHHHHHHHHHHQVSSVSSSSFVSSSRTKESSSSSSSSSQPSSNLSSKSSVALHVPKPGECQRCHRVPAAAAAVSPCPEGAQFHPGRFIFDLDEHGNDNRRWSCCDASTYSAIGCMKQNHRIVPASWEL